MRAEVRLLVTRAPDAGEERAVVGPWEKRSANMFSVA